MKIKCFFIGVFILISNLSLSQSLNNSNPNKTDFTAKNQHWLDLNLGLSFFSSNLSRIDNLQPILDDSRNYFGFIFQPKYQYFIKDKLSIGFHLGFGHESFENTSLNFNQDKQVYFTGIQSEYYVFDIDEIFYFSTELDADIQYLVRNNSKSKLYFKSGLHLNFSILFKDDFLIFVKFNDLVSFATSEDNFLYFDKGLSINNSFDNFINFPQFGIRYNLF